MFAEATVTGKGNDLHVVHGTDENLLVRFYFNKIHGADFVKINIPGDNKTEWDQPVRESDKIRFRSAWEAYKSQKNQLGNQTLLADAAIFDEAKIKTYQTFNIETVEQLANLNDAFISKIGMGTREDVKKANNYLVAMAEEGQKLKLEKELQARDEQIQQQAQQLEALQAQMAKLLNADTPKRGRPAKVPDKE
jgi:hypothetical protein